MLICLYLESYQKSKKQIETMEAFSKNGRIKGPESKFRQEIHSKVIRAGKRTYFFDVKSTRGDEYYLTITESKKRLENDGKPQYEKHKIFLYKEDFERFIVSLEEVVDYIRDKQPYGVEGQYDDETAELVEDEMPDADYSDVQFEDLSR